MFQMEEVSRNPVEELSVREAANLSIMTAAQGMCTKAGSTLDSLIRLLRYRYV